MKSVVILGSTGSIGTQTLDVIAAYPEKFAVKALACSKNVSLLKEQIDRFHPQAVAVEDEVRAALLRTQVKIPVLSGRDGIMQIAATKADLTLNALWSPLLLQSPRETTSLSLIRKRSSQAGALLCKPPRIRA